jgi:hypothetical protein
MKSTTNFFTGNNIILIDKKKKGKLAEGIEKGMTVSQTLTLSLRRDT